MHRIYAKAEKVLFWLDPACDRTAQVFAVLKTALRLGSTDLDEILEHMKRNKMPGRNDISCAILDQRKKTLAEVLHFAYYEAGGRPTALS